MSSDLTEDFERYNICWLVNFLKTNDKGVSFGICMKDKRVAFMDPAANTMKPFIINDVFIGDDGICEDNQYCLNLNCEYNQNTPEQYIKAKGMDMEDITGWDALQNRINEINQFIREENIKLQQDGILYFEKPVIELKTSGK